MGRWIAAFVMGLIAWPMYAQEHPACRDLAFVNSYDSPAELRLIASSCRAPEVSELYLNRAHYRQMLKQFERLERSLIHMGHGDNRTYIESYRIHIGLAEAFAAARLRMHDEEMLRRLNRIYDESTEIAELRFRGYDLIADRLERQYPL